jgi:hypothetical protein
VWHAAKAATITIPSPSSRDILVGLAVHLAVRVKLAELQGNTAYCMIRDPSFSDPFSLKSPVSIGG